MKLLLLILIMTPLISGIFNKHKGHDCIAQYLREKNLLDDILKDLMSGNEVDCENHVKNAKIKQQQELHDFFHALREKFDILGGQNKFRLPKGVSKEAVRSLIDEPSCVDILLKVMIVKGMRKNKKNKYDWVDNIKWKVEQEFYDKIFVALLSLASKEDFSEIFDDAMLVDVCEQIKETKDVCYCMRKHLTNKNVTYSNVEINPYNATIPSNTTCIELVANTTKTASVSLTRLFTKVLSQEYINGRLQDCIEKSINDVNGQIFFMEFAFSNYSFDKDEIAVKKVKFLEIMESVRNGTLTCMK